MMKYKTFWSISAVTRKSNKEGMRESDWILAKQREYERASGVKWSVSPQGDGWTFLPAVDQRITLPSEVPPEIVARVTEAYQTTKSPLGYVSYFDVAEESRLSLRQVMEAVRYLVKQGQAHPTVDRMGNNVYFKVKTGDRKASLKTFRELEGELSPIAQHHHLRLVCVCGNTQTCKCSEPKETYHGICNECAKKQRQASEKVGPGDSELAFEMATEIPRTDKALRATFSKSFRKGPREMLKAISRLEEPYVTLRRQSRWMDGAQEPWKEVSVKDAKQLIVLGKKLRKDLSKLLRENKIAADQQYDTDYLPRRLISPDNKWEMPTLGEEPVSEITHCQHSVNPMERGKHLMMSRELLKVAKDLLAMDTPEWASPAFVSQLDIAGTNLKKYSATYRGVQTWALQSKSKVHKDQYGWVSALWTINPALDGQNWVIESALSFAPATSGSFANQKFAEFKNTVTIAGKKDLAMFGAERHILMVKPDETNALREVNGVIVQHRDSFNAAKKFWKRQTP